MFGVVPKNLWQKSNPADDQNRIDLALRALLLKSHDKLILIDCGVGTKFDQKWSGIYKINHSKHDLKKSLTLLNLTADDITDVLISHLHFDHIGGATYYQDNQTGTDISERKSLCPKRAMDLGFKPQS